MLLQSLALLLSLSAVEPAAESTGPDPLERVAVIGASVSWGYGAHIPFQADGYVHRELVHFSDVLEASLADEHDIAFHDANMAFFNSPIIIGRRLAGNARDAKPSMVLALDYLFWYGYGSHGIDGTPHRDSESRLALLEAGLSQLDTFDCPVYVFDFPDMSPAVGRVLRASQVPSHDELAMLNARLNEWAAEHENVSVLQVSTLTEQMREDTGFKIGELTYPPGSNSRLMQRDKLHPTADGDIALAQFVLRRIDAAMESIDEDDYFQDPHLVRERLEAIASARKPPGTGPPVPED